MTLIIALILSQLGSTTGSANDSIICPGEQRYTYEDVIRCELPDGTIYSLREVASPDIRSFLFVKAKKQNDGSEARLGCMPVDGDWSSSTPIEYRHAGENAPDEEHVIDLAFKFGMFSGNKFKFKMKFRGSPSLENPVPLHQGSIEIKLKPNAKSCYKVLGHTICRYPQGDLNSYGKFKTDELSCNFYRFYP